MGDCMNKAVRNLMIGCGAATAGMAALGAVSYASTKMMVNVALDREMPRVRNLDRARDSLRGFRDSQAFLEKMNACGKVLQGTPHEEVTIQSKDGYRLVGHWFPAQHPRRVLIAMHGWRSSWNSDFGMIADFWKQNDCTVLYAEQRGQGKSGGEFMGFGMMERYDCLEWIKWVNRRYEGHLPVYLAGVSMGASTVLMTAGLDLPENVRGVMADCGFTSAHDIWKHVAKNNLHLSYGIRGDLANNLCHQKIQMKSDACSTVEAMAHCKIPVLFAHGTEDHFVPVEMTYENYRACKAPKQLLIVPGADHGMSYYLERERYQNACLEFWKFCEQKNK